MGTIEVPSDIYDALNIPDDKRNDVLRNELAISLYREGILSFGKARELADISHREFHQLLGDRQIERHYTSNDLDDDLEYTRR